MSDVTRILYAIEHGDVLAADELLPVVYQELRRLAHQRLSQEQPGQTLQATALVHEAYIRLVNTENPNWNGRGHFFAAAAEAMRRILIENARRKKNLKSGGNCHRVEFNDALQVINNNFPDDDLLALDEALDKLAQKDKLKADVVKLRFFAGLTGKETAQALGISTNSADRYWSYARAWLRLEINKGDHVI